jgi:hypothetical protein
VTDRAVKERTLALEVRHAEATGGTFRDAETANIRNLERMAARKRDARPRPLAAKPKPMLRSELAGVTRTVAKPKRVTMPRCKFCGLCRRCKRELRVAEILRRHRIGDVAVAPFANSLAIVVLAHNMRRRYRDGSVEFRFDELAGFQLDRALIAAVELVCERSALTMGTWA